MIQRGGYDGGLIHWAPGGAREAACGASEALLLSACMSRPNCDVCRDLITAQIESLKYIEPDDEPSRDAEACGEVYVSVAEQVALVVSRPLWARA